ncbi:hypothetical protein DXG03_007210 [Asterophora parasitica]|uniref:FAS1 domain-containing protein n=1 Tax=Asterophora parasitica TaxID=117018 RepID=A0A9P7KEN5_9AGAR|nr:hypothetical protein DXG03_007210 [Asterophora parasitica]
MRFPTVALVVGAVAVTAASVHPPDLAQQAFGGHHDPPDPPQKPLPWPGTGNETIYTTLSNDKEYTKLVKAINFSDKIASVLNNSKADITFFAVPDSALHRPHRRDFTIQHLDAVASLVQGYDLSDAVHLIDEFETNTAHGKGDDEKKKRRKKFLKKLLRVILSYHILPHKFDAVRLADNNTFPTNLVLPDALGSRALRIRVSHNIVSPTPTINFYSKVVRPNGPASNGIIHGVNHPLLPPPPVFQELFVAPSVFSTFTSAIQRTGLTDHLDLRYVRGKKDKKGSLEGAGAVTVFAPTNRAFDVLPKKLKLFLFSPFGTRILRKLLQYHIVPDAVFHTDYLYNETDSKDAVRFCKHQTFDISKLGALGTEEYPLRFHSSQSGCGCSGIEDYYSQFQEYSLTFMDADGLKFLGGREPFIPPQVSQEKQKEDVTAPNNPFEYNTKHYEEILAMDTEKYEALTDAQQEYAARYLELYDLLVDGPAEPMPTIHRTFHYPASVNDYRCSGTRKRLPKPIVSFHTKLPTDLGSFYIHARVEKFNVSIPIPGPRRPHWVTTKFTANGRSVFLPDVIGLNGAVHAVNQLLDPRGHHPGHHDDDEHHQQSGAKQYEAYGNHRVMDDAWDDWEEWLPKWAAEN